MLQNFLLFPVNELFYFITFINSLQLKSHLKDSFLPAWTQLFPDFKNRIEKIWKWVLLIYQSLSLWLGIKNFTKIKVKLRYGPKCFEIFKCDWPSKSVFVPHPGARDNITQQSLRSHMYARGRHNPVCKKAVYISNVFHWILQRMAADSAADIDLYAGVDELDPEIHQVIDFFVLFVSKTHFNVCKMFISSYRCFFQHKCRTTFVTFFYLNIF